MSTEPVATEPVVRKHAPCSPSKLKSLEICPSYLSEDGEVHEITLRGTAMHDALETGDDSKLVDADEVALVNMCREVTAADKEWAETTLLEIHVKTHDQDVAGFLDVAFIRGKQARIRDYKFGFNPVDGPDINPQAWAYVLGVFLKYPEIEEIEFSFLMPRLDAISEHTFTRADIPKLKTRISLIAERRRKLAGVEFNPNNENCLYCSRKASCQALIDKALVVANKYNEDDQLALPTEFHSSLILDPKEMARALNVAAVMEKWCDSVRSHALKLRTELGAEIPGYDLVERQGRRVIDNPIKALEIATNEFGLTEEEFTSAASVSFNDLAKILMDKAPKGEKAKRRAAFEDRLRDEMALSKSGTYLILQKTKKTVKTTA